MEEAMRLLIDGAMVWNGTGAPPFPGKVLVEGERIAAIAPQSETLAADGADRIDAAGKFLMPGMVEGHAHLSFVDTPRGTALANRSPRGRSAPDVPLSKEWRLTSWAMAWLGLATLLPPTMILN